MAAVPLILNRDEARGRAAVDTAALLGTVREMVDEGTQLLARLLADAAKQNPPRPLHTALLLLLRHIIENLDAVDELLRAGIVTPAALQCRAILEAHMQILFLSGQRTRQRASTPGRGHVHPVPCDTAGKPLMGATLEEKRDERGLAYIVGEIRKRAAEADTFATAVVQPWFTAMTGGMNVPAPFTDPAFQQGLAAEATQLRSRLLSPEMQPIDAAFTKLRGRQPYDPNWYAIDGGPARVRQLADSVGLAASYELFYGDASDVMHGTNIGGQIGGAHPRGGQSVAPLRSAQMAGQVGRRAILDVIEVYQLVIAMIRPSDQAYLNPYVARWSGIAATLR
jgi:hypothetical protein